MFVCEQCGASFTRRGLKRNETPRFCGRACKYANAKTDPAVRFFEKVHRGAGCWIWKGIIDDDGYGVFWLNGRNWRAHRASYTLFVGGIPSGRVVCHGCDTPACVRPDHLFVGDHADNIHDMMRKGRATFQKDNAAFRERMRQGQQKRPIESFAKTEDHLKIKDDLVRAIREAHQQGQGGYRVLARRFGVSTSYVGDLITRRRRKIVG